MQSCSRLLIKTSVMKVVVASLIAAVLCVNLALPTLSANANNPEIDERLTAASSRFAFKLYNQVLKQQSGKNTFVSPASVMLALVMTYNGAEGTTREGMARALELEGMSLDEVNRSFADLKTALNPTDPKIKLNIANSLWARNGFTLKPEFVKRGKDYYEASLATLNFDDPAAPDTINAWVSKNTEGKIEKIIDRIGPNAVLFLINAIYFKGQWQFEFDKKKTQPDTFKLPGGQKKDVSMMRAQSENHFYFKGKDFQAIALPYGSGSVSMFIFLPDEQTGLEQFERNLTPENWNTWMTSFRPTPGDLMLPRFKVEWEAKLNDSLRALGMAQAFDPQSANFSQMADVNAGNKLYISEVKHKTWAEVNEEGTVAAAATSVGVGLTSVQEPRERFVMKVDRPFFFAIRDNKTQVLLFMGSVVNPG